MIYDILDCFVKPTLLLIVSNTEIKKMLSNAYEP
jgi:hypothetical protein